MRRLVLAVLLILAVAAPAVAVPGYHPGHADTSWRQFTYSNGYYLDGDPIDYGSPMRFEVSRRWTHDIRLYRSVADTWQEYRNLRSFARRSPNVGEPTVFCQTGQRSGYMLDLLYWYDTALYGSLTRAEAHGYRAWAIRYVKVRPSCTAFFARP